MEHSKYKILGENTFQLDEYSLVPIRKEDMLPIMHWRNEQIDILRQKEPLTPEMQDVYYTNVVSTLFEEQYPGQLLFSFLENSVLIGYGGLVHIDWESKNAEISFITATSRNRDHSQFTKDWTTYLSILIRIVKEQLMFKKIYTYAYDIRPHLYPILISAGFVEEARLKNHILINNNYFDVVIHAYYF